MPVVTLLMTPATVRLLPEVTSKVPPATPMETLRVWIPDRAKLLRGLEGAAVEVKRDGGGRRAQLVIGADAQDAAVDVGRAGVGVAAAAAERVSVPAPDLVRMVLPLARIGVLMVRESPAWSVRITISSPPAALDAHAAADPVALPLLPDLRMPLTVSVAVPARVKLLFAASPSVPARFKVVNVAVLWAVMELIVLT